MTEDAAYRASTQYKLWSFTPSQLSAFRASTNALAATRVRAAIQRAREAQKKAGVDVGEEGEVDCLTVEEEEKLVGYYCGKAMELADFLEFPSAVKLYADVFLPLGLTDTPTAQKATAVQYLKRFYLSNSPMTYHPKPLMLTSLFLATKTENHYTRLTSFASRIPGKKPTTPEDVIAPEFLLTQGLRFTFEVRHPFRGLEGGVMGLLGMVRKDGGGLEGLEGGDVRERIHLAHSKAKHLLKTSALLTDAYFLATPSQLWLSALLAADQPLALFYLSTITPSTTHEGSPGNEPLSTNTKLLAQLNSISQLLLSPPAHTTDMEEARRVDKKVYFCRNPEKVDLRMLGKRGSESEDGGRKRRKQESNGDGDGGVFG